MPRGLHRGDDLALLLVCQACPPFVELAGPLGSPTHEGHYNACIVEVKHCIDQMTPPREASQPAIRRPWTERGKDAGRRNSQAISPTEDTAPRSVQGRRRYPRSDSNRRLTG